MLTVKLAMGRTTVEKQAKLSLVLRARHGMCRLLIVMALEDLEITTNVAILMENQEPGVTLPVVTRDGSCVMSDNVLLVIKVTTLGKLYS